MVNKITNFFNLAGLTWFVPIARMAAGESPKEQLKQLWLIMGIPIAAFMLFLVLWGQLANSVETSLGKIPGPAAVYEEAKGLWAEHKETRAKAAAFYQRQEERNAKRLEKDPNAEVKWRTYTGKSTYVDQIYTSLKTVFMGFFIATVIAVPLGIFCGLSPIVNSAFNPIIQIFKPVSPLAWLPIVTMVV
ncbi:MAG TPA: ABC transporter permease, partial [Marinagarivorans sp.]